VSIRFGECVLDTEAQQLRRGGSAVPLTAKALQLLGLLIEKRPKAVPKKEIYDRLWPSTFVAEVNLARLIFEVRAAVGDDARRPRYIRTVRGFGYAWCIDVAPDSGSDEGTSYRLVFDDREVGLSEGENVLGRTRRAAVWIDSTSVSRRHARIVIAGDQATVEDLGSKNGTCLGGRRLGGQPARLADGDVLKLGSVTMTFRVLQPEVSTATT
jgi:DNA-binding winged helix-turn-helix (wHTH) protein